MISNTKHLSWHEFMAPHVETGIPIEFRHLSLGQGLSSVSVYELLQPSWHSLNLPIPVSSSCVLITSILLSFIVLWQGEQTIAQWPANPWMELGFMIIPGTWVMSGWSDGTTSGFCLDMFSFLLWWGLIWDHSAMDDVHAINNQCHNVLIFRFKGHWEWNMQQFSTHKCWRWLLIQVLASARCPTGFPGFKMISTLTTFHGTCCFMSTVLGEIPVQGAAVVQNSR